MRRRSRQLIEVAGLLLLFVAGAVIYTWPLAASLATAFVFPVALPSLLALADVYLTSWILAWGAHQLVHAPLHLFDANFFYPLPHALAFSEHLLAGVLLVLPIDLATHNAILDHNVLVLASFALGATGVALLVRDLGGSMPAAMAAGALFAFGPLRLAQLSHVHALSTQWMPFALLFLQRFLRNGGARTGAAFALCLLLTAASSVYYLYYFGLAVILFLAVHAAYGCPARPSTRRAAIVLGAGAALVMVPLLLPYARLRTMFALAHDTTQAAEFSAVAAQYLAALLHPGMREEPRFVDGRLYTALFGTALVALAALGLWRGAAPQRGGRRIVAVYVTVAVLFALLSLGPTMRMSFTSTGGIPGPHWLLAAVVPGFDALRVPQRAASIVLLLLAVLAGLGADALVGRDRSARTRVAGGLVVAALVAVECWRTPLQILRDPSGSVAPPAYRWLAAQSGDVPVLELPVGDAWAESRYMLLSTHHWKRLVNGYSGSFPARNYLERVLAGFPDDDSLRLLRGLRVRFVILHRSTECAPSAAPLPPDLIRRYADADTCVLEVLGGPRPSEAPPDRLVSLADARMTTSSGDDPGAARDGDASTHWVQPVAPEQPAWLQIDLPESHALTRLVLRLGPHFGEYLRAYRLETSLDGATWTTVKDEIIAEPPLIDLVDHPENLATEIALDGAPVRHLRLVRPTTSVGGLYLDWGWWGVHELELYEAIAPPAPR